MNFRWNHLHEGKRVRHVFTDFDDTIAHDASSDMGPEGFNRLVGPSTTKQHFAFNVLKNAASRLDKNKRSKVGIVTARHKSVIPHLRKWLHDKEVPNADKVKIHAVGHLTEPLSADEIARRKVKAIGSHVRKGEIRKGDEVHFFDDAKSNVDAVASMRHKGVRFRSVGVGPGRKTKLKEQRMKITKKKSDAEATRIFPTGTEKQNRPNKSFETFVSEMFHVLEGAQWIPLNPAEDPERAERLLAARRKKSEEAARNANVDNARGWHTGGWSKEQKIKAIMAGSPGMSREEAAKKASLRIGKQKKVNESHNIETLKGIPTSRLRKLHAKYKAKGTKEASREASVIKRVLASRVDEAVSTNDPNRGKPGRKKPLVPQGMMPDDTKDTKTGKRVKSSGKVQKRLSTLSDAGRNEYYKKVGIRSRAASRGGRTQRLYWGLYEEEKEKKDRYEGEESTSSMIARLVARRHRKLGMKVPADVEHDIDPKYKTKED